MDDLFTQQIHSRGYRMTPQRLAILNILDKAGRHLSPLEVHEQARLAIPGLTEATIYRTLSFLTEQGLLLAAHIGNGQMVYEMAGHNHHHLICRLCGGSCKIDHDLLEPLYRQLESQTGFYIDTIHVTFFGICPDCLKDSPHAPPQAYT